MVTKNKAAKTRTQGALNKEALRSLLSTAPGLPAAKLEDEATRILGFLKTHPELQGRLDAGTLTLEQLRTMVHTDTAVTLGQSSDLHTQRALDRYLGIS